MRLKGLLNKSNKVAILELSEFGPDSRGNSSGKEPSNIDMNAFQPDHVGNLCRVIGGVQVEDQEANNQSFVFGDGFPYEVHFPLGDPRQLRVREEILPNIAVTAGQINERRDLARLEIVPETEASEKQPTTDRANRIVTMFRRTVEDSQLNGLASCILEH